MSFGVPTSFGLFQSSSSTNTSIFAGNTSSGFGTGVFGQIPTISPMFGQTSSSAGHTMFGVPVNNSSSMNTSPFGVSTPGFGIGVNTSPFGVSTPSSFNIGGGLWQTGSTAMTINEHDSPADKIASISTVYNNKSHEELRSENYGNIKGSRRSPYATTPFEEEVKGIKTSFLLCSISAMPIYINKSHEELRIEDYEERAKGVQTPWGNKAPAANIFTHPQGSNPSPFTSVNTPSTNPFSPSTNPFNLQPQTPTTTTTTPSPSISPSPLFHNPFTTTQPTNPFSPSSIPFAPQTPTDTTSVLPSPFNPFTTTQPTNPFSPSTNLFPSTNTAPTPSIPPSPFATQPTNPFSSITNPFAPQTQTPANTTTPTPSSLFYEKNKPFATQPTTPFSPMPNLFAPKTQTPTNTITPTPTPQPQPFMTPNNSIIRASTPAMTSDSIFHTNTTNTFAPPSLPFNTAPLGPCTPVLNISQPGQTSTAIPSQPSQVITSIVQPEAVTSTLRGISSLPVKNNSAPVRISSSYRIRHLSSRRVSLPANRYKPENSASKVPFFGDKEYKPCLAVPFLPRDNPRAWVINRSSEPEHAPVDTYKEVQGETCEDKAGVNSCFQVKENFKVDNDASLLGKLHLADDPLVSSLMPKLPCGEEYYTEPSIKELEEKERAEPGFCSRVKNFVVGRKEKGSIEFLGEIDIRHLDLESIVQFNDREVIVYRDDENKPPVGQGLNRPAEVTLLNVKFLSKTSGKQFSDDGHQVQKMEKMLMKKTNEQGAEFVSYNPVRGEWKFRVEHF